MKRMNVFYWLPRILAIFYIGFLALFALDVFIPGKDIMYYATALFMHLIPNFILTAVLFVAWKREQLGGILFIILAFVMSLYFRNPLQVSVMLFGPLMFIGALFLIHNWFAGKKARLV